MTKLTAVYLTKTLHVLAALTRTDPPQGDEPVSALIGTGLPVRFIGQLPVNVTFHATDLSAVTVDDQPDVLVNRQNYQVAPDPKTQALQVTAVGPTNLVTPAIVSASSATIQVALPTPVPAIVVLQQLTPVSPPPFIKSLLTIPFVPTPVLGASAFAPGDVWNMYVLVLGLPPVSQKFTV